MIQPTISFCKVARLSALSRIGTTKLNKTEKKTPKNSTQRVNNKFLCCFFDINSDLTYEEKKFFLDIK